MCIVHVNGVYWKYYIITMLIFYIDLQIFNVQYEPLIVEIETYNKSYWRKTVNLKTYYSNNDIYVFSSYFLIGFWQPFFSNLYVLIPSLQPWVLTYNKKSSRKALYKERQA